MTGGAKAVFLDRDGTINRDVGYLYRREDFAFLPGAVEGMRLLHQAGYLLVIVTNQSGIARGFYGESDYRALNDWLLRELARLGAPVAGSYCCPHHPEAAVAAYRQVCACRKPQPGLFLQAAEELSIDMDGSVAMGDRLRDLAPLAVSRCRGYWIGGRKEDVPPEWVDRVEITDSLLEGARHIIGAP